MPRCTTREIAERLGARLIGDPERVITGVGSLASAGPEDLAFLESPRHAADLDSSAAGAVILPHDVRPPERMCGIELDRPALGMAQAIDLLVPPRRTFRDISPNAFLGIDVVVGPGVGIGPNVYVGDRVTIGQGTEIHPGVTIGRDSAIGEACLIHAGVHLYERTSIGHRVILHSGAVIGADGFGYADESAAAGAEGPGNRHRKIRQVGRVVIEDDVEIGANSTIDRAALDVTRIGRGTKIDNLVTVGHNCVLGRHCIVVGQAGIGGSTRVGDHVTIAGQAGLADHLRIGSGVVIGAQAGVTNDVREGSAVVGSPAIEAIRAKKAAVLVGGLPELKKMVVTLGRRLGRLENDLQRRDEDIET